jgi:MarR family transcriptional regulator, organic hydroperoxide resistance regulator
VTGRTHGISHAIADAARTHLAVADRLLREHGLYPGQEVLLMRLWRADHQSQAELARALGKGTSTVGRTVQSLERSGLVTRSRSQADRRSVVVSLTPAGSGLRQEIDQMWADLEARAAAGLSNRQRAELLRLLRHVERSLRDGGRVTVS